MILMNPVLVKLSFELLLSGGHLGTGEEWVSLTLTYRPTGQHTPPPIIPTCDLLLQGPLATHHTPVFPKPASTLSEFPNA